MVSLTPRTDQKIRYCFKKAKYMVTIMTICLIISIPFWFMVYHCLIQGEDLWSFDRETMIYAISCISGWSWITGIAYNLIHLLGLNVTKNCLSKCEDKKTHIFIKGIKTMRILLILDTIMTIIPPVKTITTIMYYIYVRKYKKMVRVLKSERKEQQFGLYHEKSLLNKKQEEED